jgi:hypothetical protein
MIVAHCEQCGKEQPAQQVKLLVQAFILPVGWCGWEKLSADMSSSTTHTFCSHQCQRDYWRERETPTIRERDDMDTDDSIEEEE